MLEATCWEEERANIAHARISLHIEVIFIYFSSFREADQCLPRQQYRGLKIDRDQASKELRRSIGLAWKHLPAEKKAEYQQEALDMQAARSALQTKSLGGESARQEASGSELSTSQVKRLNNARLDRTLESFANHPCWQRGLALGDHICALKASLVLPLDADKCEWRELRAEYSDVFGYDSNILQNPKPMPGFIRACYTVQATAAL